MTHDQTTAAVRASLLGYPRDVDPRRRPTAAERIALNEAAGLSHGITLAAAARIASKQKVEAS